MKENILQIAAAILLGLMIPGAIIRLTTNVPGHASVEPPTQPSVQQEAPQQGIWVLTEEGNTQWMALQEYLIGVILAEMPTTYEHNALCAKTAARPATSHGCGLYGSGVLSGVYRCGAVSGRKRI